MQIMKIVLARFIACLFFIPEIAQAKIIKDEVSLVAEESYSYSQVCDHLTKRPSPLISYVSISKLDCMGQKVEVSKFCDQKTQDDPYYIRAVINKEQKKIICKSAKRVHIKYACESKDDQFCQDKEIGCYLMQEKFAKRLKSAHVSILDGPKGKILSCHFTPKTSEMDTPLDKI